MVYILNNFFLVGNIIHFRFEVGNGIQTLEKITAYPMNDNEWHTVHVERNRKQAWLKVHHTAFT
jgi:contactin associated protein-like 2